MKKWILNNIRSILIIIFTFCLGTIYHTPLWQIILIYILSMISAHFICFVLQFIMIVILAGAINITEDKKYLTEFNRLLKKYNTEEDL